MKLNRKILTSNWGIMTIMTILFLLWVFVFDRNSYLEVNDLKERVEELEQERDFYIQSIARDSAVITGLNDSTFVEKFARENFHMKRENETMYIIK